MFLTPSFSILFFTIFFGYLEAPMTRLHYLALFFVLPCLTVACHRGPVGVGATPIQESPPVPSGFRLPDVVPPDVGEITENFRRVHFDFDSSTLTSGAVQVLKTNARLLERRPELLVQVQGHCDERGSFAYNLALGERRAEAITRFLEQEGIAAERLTAVSYGERIPRERHHDESGWWENRRGEFVITGGDDGSVTGSPASPQP